MTNPVKTIGAILDKQSEMCIRDRMKAPIMIIPIISFLFL